MLLTLQFLTNTWLWLACFCKFSLRWASHESFRRGAGIRGAFAKRTSETSRKLEQLCTNAIRVVVGVGCPDALRRVGDDFHNRRKVPEASLEKGRGTPVHTQARQVEPKMEARELQARLFGQGGNAALIAVRLKVVEAVVERRVTIGRPMRLQILRDVGVDVHRTAPARRRGDHEPKRW